MVDWIKKEAKNHEVSQLLSNFQLIIICKPDTLQSVPPPSELETSVERLEKRLQALIEASAAANLTWEHQRAENGEEVICFVKKQALNLIFCFAIFGILSRLQRS